MARARALLRARDLDGAQKALADVISRDDAPAAAQMLYDRILLMQVGSDVNPPSGADALADRRGDAVLGRELLRHGQVEDARVHLVHAIRKYPDDAALYALLAEVCLKTGDAARARYCIDRACKFAPENQTYIVQKLVVFCALGEVARAERVLRPVAECADQVASLVQDTLVYFAQHGRTQEGVALAKNACKLLPPALPLRLFCADRLYAAKQYAEALALLDENPIPVETMPVEQARRFIKARGSALAALGDKEAAIAAYAHALALQPEDQDALRQMYLLHQKQGRTAEMRTYGQRLAGVGARTLPETLAAGLAAIRPQRIIVRTAATADKLAWAWELADQSRWQKDSWLAAIDWGRQADKLLRAWWLNVPERVDELDALIDRPGRSVAELLGDARCLGVTTHLGPMAGNVRYFQTCGRPFRGFGVRGADPVVGEGPPMRIAIGDAGSALRQLLLEIRKGTLIGFAQDLPDLHDGMRLPFLGRTVSLSTFVPRLIVKQRTASLWCQSRWRDGRIVVEIERLPDPDEGEPLEAWCRRWCTAYLQKIEDVMRGAPENLNLGIGIWQNLDPVFRSLRLEKAKSHLQTKTAVTP